MATHNLFFLREIEMILAADKIETRYFGLQSSKDGVTIKQGAAPEDMGSIAVLDEELEQ